MQKFRCFKVVEAGKIVHVYRPGDTFPDVEMTGGGSLVRLEGESSPRALESKHDPQVGGYYIRYSDGYTSFSPAAAFEEGYVPIEAASRESVERIAIACHEANRGYALATGEDPATVFPPWYAAPFAIRESARVGVRAALDGATPEELHVSWLRSKAADGWTYGPVKDLATKRHPCCVPYEELPPAQRAKDGMFAAIARALQ